MPTKAKAWAIALANHAQMVQNQHDQWIHILKDHIAADSGAMGNFLLTNAHVTNIKITHDPLIIKPPDGVKLRTLDTCQLKIPSLPPQAMEAHLVPQLTHMILILIKQLCNVECTAMFTNMDVRIYYKN